MWSTLSSDEFEAPALRETPTWMQLVLDTLSDAVVVCDLDGHIRYLNFLALQLIARGQLPQETQLVPHILKQIPLPDTHQSVAEILHSLTHKSFMPGVNSEDIKSISDSMANFQICTLPLQYEGQFVGVVFNLRPRRFCLSSGCQLYYQATHDELTGLLNRREFNQRVERALAYHRPY